MEYEKIGEEKQQKIRDFFKGFRMTDTSEVESDALALSWIEKHRSAFYGFIDGCWMNEEKITEQLKSTLESHKLCDIFSEKQLCEVFVSRDRNLLEYAAKSSYAAFDSWSILDSRERSQILVRIAQTIEKRQQLFSVTEAISTGKHLHKARKDVSNLIEHFYYYAGCALKLEESVSSKRWFPTGPICVVTNEYNNPSLVHNLRVGAALASGNSVVILANMLSPLSAFLLAEICSDSGLPPGVLNVIPINQQEFERLYPSEFTSNCPFPFTKFVFTGTADDSRSFSKHCSLLQLPCNFLISRRPVIIVYENADLHSAAEGAMEAFIYQDTRSKSGGCKIMVQESIYNQFTKILVERFSKLKIGINFSKTDFSAAITDEQEKIIEQLVVETTEQSSTQFHHIFSESPAKTTMLPVLFTKIANTNSFVQKELGGPIAITIPFRTLKESISMFNCDDKGSPVSIWDERSSVALEAAFKLKTGVIWINSQNVVDPSITFTGVYSSGNSVEGGKDSFFSHLSLHPMIDRYRESDKDNPVVVTKIYPLNRGGLPAPEKKFLKEFSVSDLESAISNAVSAQSSWENSDHTHKRKILMDILAKFKNKKQEFITELQKITKEPLEACEKEVSETSAVLHNWLAQSGRCSESVQERKNNIVILQSRKALGVIGIQCPDEKPLLSFVSLVIAAVLCGNTVVVLTSKEFPTPALKMTEIFASAQVPRGVINVGCGNVHLLLPIFCKHPDVNSIWFSWRLYGDVFPHYDIYPRCNPVQRTFDCSGIWNNISEDHSFKCVLEATYAKSVYLPFGDIFAN